MGRSIEERPSRSDVVVEVVIVVVEVVEVVVLVVEVVLFVDVEVVDFLVVEIVVVKVVIEIIVEIVIVVVEIIVEIVIVVIEIVVIIVEIVVDVGVVIGGVTVEEGRRQAILEGRRLVIQFGQEGGHVQTVPHQVGPQAREIRGKRPRLGFPRFAGSSFARSEAKRGALEVVAAISSVTHWR